MEDCGVGERFQVKFDCEEVAHSQSLQENPSALLPSLSLVNEISLASRPAMEGCGVGEGFQTRQC